MGYFERHKHQISLHAVIFIWGFTGILGRIIELPPFSIVWWRIFIAVIGLAIFMVYDKRPFATSPVNRIKYLLTGLVTAGHWLFFFMALKEGNVSITLTTLASTSLFVALLEPMLFRRRVIGYEILFGLTTIGGLALIFQAEQEHALAILYALISAFLAALFGTLNGIFVQHDRPSLITFHELLGGVLGLSLFALFSGESIHVPVGIDWMWLFILGIICTSLAFVVSIEVMKSLSPFTVSISINMEPIYSIIFALIIFKDQEYMSPLFYVGAALVMGMIFLNSLIKGRAKKKTPSIVPDVNTIDGDIL